MGSGVGSGVGCPVSLTPSQIASVDSSTPVGKGASQAAGTATTLPSS